MYDLPEETQIQLDQPSSLDLEYEPLFGSNDYGVSSVNFPTPEIQNQGAEDITRMACSRFGLTHIVNAQNKFTADHTNSSYNILKAKDYWLEYLKINPSAESQGATLQSALDQFKKDGLITGYVRCTDSQSMKDSLQKGRLIYTGSQNGDWNSVRDTHIYRLRTDGRVVGHVFCILGYDDSGWVAINSYGELNGVFHIPFDLTDTLFTRYSVCDSKDEEAIISYKKSIMDKITIEDAKLALEAKIWNGTRPQETATREETAAMIQRAIMSLQK